MNKTIRAGKYRAIEKQEGVVAAIKALQTDIGSTAKIRTIPNPMSDREDDAFVSMLTDVSVDAVGGIGPLFGYGGTKAGSVNDLLEKALDPAQRVPDRPGYSKNNVRLLVGEDMLNPDSVIQVLKL